MKNDTPIAESMTPVLDAVLALELVRLVKENMAEVENTYAPRLRWEADADHLAEVIGDHYSYRVLRRTGFVPGNRGTWNRPARTANPDEVVSVESLDVDALAPALRRAVRALDPARVLASLATGADAWR